jgi:hypothetical protein
MTVRVLALLAAGAAAACAAPQQRPWSGAEYCHLDAASAPAGHERWLALLLRGYDRSTGRATVPAIDCANLQVRWEGPAAACADGALATTILPPRPLEEADVVVSPPSDGHRLVWVMTNRFAAGDALGPVAVVEEERGRLVVRALGTLRAYPGKAALRLERIGATTVLVAEGELCAAGGAGCVRSARIMPLRADYFRQEQLYTEAGTCASAAWLDLSRAESEPLPSGWSRRYRLDATLAFGPEGLRVAEHVQVHDLDPREPQTPPRLYRNAEGEREIRVQGGRMVATGAPLWTKVVPARR